MSAAKLRAWREARNLDKLLRLVDVLIVRFRNANCCVATYLNVLTRDLDIVEPGVVELDQVATTLVQRLSFGSRIEIPLVCISPPLQASDVLAKLRHVLHEVFFDRSLCCQRVPPTQASTYLQVARQIVRELVQVLLSHSIELAIVIWNTTPAAPLLLSAWIST